MLSTLTDELIVTILEFVPPLDLLQTVSRLSKRYSSLVDCDAFWRYNELSSLSGASEDVVACSLARETHRAGFSMTKHELQQCCIFAAFCKRRDEASGAASSMKVSSQDDNDDEDGNAASATVNPPPFLEYGSLLISRSAALRLRNHNNRRVCAASSTDHVGEAIENVLYDADSDAFRPPPPPPNATIHDWIALWRVLMMQPERWWSSKPSPTQESSELLLFCLRCPLAIVSQVSIKPLKDPEGRNIIYLWDKMIIRAYRVPMEALADPSEERFPGYPGSLPCSSSTTREENDEVMNGPQQNPQPRARRDENLNAPAPSDHETITMLLDGHDPVYESPVMAMDETDQESMTELCFPRSVAANVVTIELLGKKNEQVAQSGYYACVDKISCRGIPLYQDREERQRVREAFVVETDPE